MEITPNPVFKGCRARERIWAALECVTGPVKALHIYRGFDKPLLAGTVPDAATHVAGH
ncbi:MAG: hypothetical protein HY678_12615 [Chloroflexi bacterium]|nr:hypothetical protein [Chloroflexota bacterium]